MQGKLEIIDSKAKYYFDTLASNHGFNPNDTWVGGYVDYEWNHFRHIIQAYEFDLNGKQILEFGCNFGASAIVLAKLGANVIAIDVNATSIAIAKANAAIYGTQNSIQFIHIKDTRDMPFKDNQFDLITCNSVLEYIPNTILYAVQQEIDRVLKLNGVIFITGTSNRLWPVEVHSQKWFINYIPDFLDKWLFFEKKIGKGVYPWQVRYGFGNYTNIDLRNSGTSFFNAKCRIGSSAWKIKILKIMNAILSPFKLWIGTIIPSISLVLQKNKNHTD